MDSQLDDNNLLTQYLLGGLPAARVEELDELSIVDGEFASQLGEVENDLIDAYVRGEMIGQTRVQFEAHYLTSPRRREKVKFAQSLQTFTEIKVRERSPKAVVIETPAQEIDKTKSELISPVNTVAWWQRWFTIPSLKLQGGLAAGAVLLFISGGWLLLETFRLREQVAKTETERATLGRRAKELQSQLETQQANASKESEQLRLEMQRTQEKLAQLKQQQIAQQRAPIATPIDPKIVAYTLSPQTMGPLANIETITIPLEIASLRLTLELETNEFTAYQAELQTPAGDQNVWKKDNLKPRSKGQAKVITIIIPANKLTTGGYNLTLRGIATDHKLGRERSYYFRVVRP